MSINQELKLNLKKNITLFIKREDLLHPIISGNKYRKLKYNLQNAKEKNIKTLLTFGGAFSNHILAVAGAGKEYNFNSIGIIRGEELFEKINENPTLKNAQNLGMKFEFVDRTTYKNKNEEKYIKSLKDKFGKFYLIPEGGTNKLAIKGCEEILSENDSIFSHICCSVGTGGTISGIINSSNEKQQIIGFSSLKGGFLKEDITKFVTKNNWVLNSDFHFGGYGKVDTTLVSFINEFYEEYSIPLDPIYTGKMMYGIFKLINNNFFEEGSKILAIHTGGLQGISGINKLLKQKGKQTIII